MLHVELIQHIEQLESREPLLRRDSQKSRYATSPGDPADLRQGVLVDGGRNSLHRRYILYFILARNGHRSAGSSSTTRLARAMVTAPPRTTWSAPA